MELTITKQAFKSQAQKQHAVLKLRGVELKLSDVQESLAVAFGYENLATMYAKFSAEEFSVVDATPLREQINNLFVVFVGEIEEDDWREGMCVYAPEVTLDDIETAANRFCVSEYDDKRVALPEGWAFPKDTVGLSTFAITSDISEYGFPDSVNEFTATSWVKKLGFRVPKEGVDISYFDRGDDGSGDDFLLIWVPDEEAALLRKIFSDTQD